MNKIITAVVASVTIAVLAGCGRTQVQSPEVGDTHQSAGGELEQSEGEQPQSEDDQQSQSAGGNAVKSAEEWAAYTGYVEDFPERDLDGDGLKDKLYRTYEESKTEDESPYVVGYELHFGNGEKLLLNRSGDSYFFNVLVDSMDLTGDGQNEILIRAGKLSLLVSQQAGYKGLLGDISYLLTWDEKGDYNVSDITFELSDYDFRQHERYDAKEEFRNLNLDGDGEYTLAAYDKQGEGYVEIQMPGAFPYTVTGDGEKVVLSCRELGYEEELFAQECGTEVKSLWEEKRKQAFGTTEADGVCDFSFYRSYNGTEEYEDSSGVRLQLKQYLYGDGHSDLLAYAITTLVYEDGKYVVCGSGATYPIYGEPAVE